MIPPMNLLRPIYPIVEYAGLLRLSTQNAVLDRPGGLSYVLCCHPMSSTIVSAGLGSPEAAMLARLLPQITLADGPHEAIAVRAPYTGCTIGTIPAGTVADLELAVQRARAAQTAWSRRTFASRAHIFLRFHDLLMERQDEVLDLIQWAVSYTHLRAHETR